MDGSPADVPSLPHQSLLADPVLDRAGDLIGVAVHHHHVGVALDPGLRQVDPIDLAAPAGHALLAELVDRVERELHAVEAGALDVAVGRPDTEQLPGLALGAEDRLSLVDLRVARPRRAATLDRVGDVDVVPSVEEETLPARLAVGLGLPGDAGH